MKAPMALVVAILMALVVSQAGFASNVGNPTYQPIDPSYELNPSSENAVNYEDDTPEGKSKVRGAKKQCGSKDKDCKDGE